MVGRASASGGYTGSLMERRRRDRPGRRLARSYLAVRAEQSAEGQPEHAEREVRATIRLPRLDRLHLSSPEAHAQYRVSLLARLTVGGEAWFTLAEVDRPGRRRLRLRD